MPDAYIDVDDVIRGYVWGLIGMYGWPRTLEKESLKAAYPDVDWLMHFQVGRHSTFLMGLEPIYGAIGGVWSVSTRYRVHYTTATNGGGLEEVVTRKWLRKWGFPNTNRLVCLGRDGGKVDYLIENAKYKDVVIDDQMKYIKPVFDSTSAITIVFDSPWNRSIRVHHRARTWEEIVAILVKEEK